MEIVDEKTRMDVVEKAMASFFGWDPNPQLVSPPSKSVDDPGSRKEVVPDSKIRQTDMSQGNSSPAPSVAPVVGSADRRTQPDTVGFDPEAQNPRRSEPLPIPIVPPLPPSAPQPLSDAQTVRRDVYAHLTDDEMMRGGLFTLEGQPFALVAPLRNGMVIPFPELGKEVHIRRKKPTPVRITLALKAAEARAGGVFQAALLDGTRRSLSLPGNLQDGQIVPTGTGDLEVVIKIRRGLFERSR